jgi:hypothetical protein
VSEQPHAADPAIAAAQQQHPPVDPASTEYVVIRPEGDLEGTEMASVYEGEWRKRADLADEQVIPVDGADGIVKAYPTQQVEYDRAGDVGQVYQVPHAESGAPGAKPQDPGDSPPPPPTGG